MKAKERTRLAIRILEARETLEQKRTYKDDFYLLYPHWNTPNKREKVDKVIYLRAFDEAITNDLEKFAEKIKEGWL